MIKKSKHARGLWLAKLIGKQSRCPKRQVGCVMINEDNRILSTGYNDLIRGLPHCEQICKIDPESERKICQCTHAELDAMLQCSNIRLIHTVYVTLSPCINCAKLLANSSMENLVWSEYYKETKGLDFLKNLGINLIHERICD